MSWKTYMIIFLLYSLFWIHDNLSWEAIRRLNSVKREAATAFEDKKYDKAADLYFQLTYIPLLPKPENRFNLALSYLNSGENVLAAHHFHLLDNIDNEKLASKANVQLARLDIAKNDTAAALQHLIKALKYNVNNQTARHNLEILKLNFSGNSTEKLTQLPKTPSAPHSTPPPKNDGEQRQTNANVPPEISNKREQLLKQLKSLQMSEDQAQSILDAMKTNELQYIYQLRKKQFANPELKSNLNEW